MLGKYVEMTYLWEKGISFFTSASPFPSVQDSFWGLGKYSVICRWKPFKNQVWKVPQGDLSRYPEGRNGGDGNGRAAMVAFSGAGADRVRVLQLGTSLAAPAPLSAAENQERYWVRIFPGSLEDGHRAKHQGRAQCLCIPHCHCVHFLGTLLSVGFFPNFLLITTCTIHILAE